MFSMLSVIPGSEYFFVSTEKANLNMEHGENLGKSAFLSSSGKTRAECNRWFLNSRCMLFVSPGTGVIHFWCKQVNRDRLEQLTDFFPPEETQSRFALVMTGEKCKDKKCSKPAPRYSLTRTMRSQETTSFFLKLTAHDAGSVSAAAEQSRYKDLFMGVPSTTTANATSKWYTTISKSLVAIVALACDIFVRWSPLMCTHYFLRGCVSALVGLHSAYFSRIHQHQVNFAPVIGAGRCPTKSRTETRWR